MKNVIKVKKGEKSITLKVRHLVNKGKFNIEKR